MDYPSVRDMLIYKKDNLVCSYMKEKLMKFRYGLKYGFLLRNWIIFESSPDFSDNTYYVYQEFLRRGLDKNFKLIWLLRDKKSLNVKTPKNVIKVYRFGGGIQKMRYLWYTTFSKYIIDCNDYVKKTNREQFRIHLTHGAPIKMPWKYCSECGEVDYIDCLSPVFTDPYSKLFGVEKRKIVSLGFPRNDALFVKSDSAKKFRKKLPCKKLILWMPTYRNKCNDEEKRNLAYYDYCVPSMTNSSEASKLNDYLRKREAILLIKPHPSEDISKLQALDLGNIRIISNDDLEEARMTVYDLCSIVDALITDYSSIYYDFLLTRKPIALAIEDIEDYKKENDLLFDDFESNFGAEYIYDFKDVMTFVEDVVENKDKERGKRFKSLSKYHEFVDGKSSSRVVDFFLEKNGYGKKSD